MHAWGPGKPGQGGESAPEAFLDEDPERCPRARPGRTRAAVPAAASERGRSGGRRLGSVPPAGSPRAGERRCFPLGGKCVFPFYYNNGLFYDCVEFNAKHKWCSLTETFKGHWKYCSEEGECPPSEALRVVVRGLGAGVR